MMQITVLFFATLKDNAGTNRAPLVVPDSASVSQVKKLLLEQFPRIEVNLSRALVSINQEFAFDEDIVPDGAEIAFFPPVSGGSFPTILKVVYEPLNLDDLIAEITEESTGAVCVFSGIVRGKTQRGDAHDTVRLEYEAYIPMAEAKMGQVADEIRQRWPSIEGIVIVQRIGELQPGTPTVLIACAASHRDTGVFEAARYGIDRLKEIVPIWKKEIGPTGETWVEGHYHPHQGD
jgi:molybdopterin synthase catalytic subunit